MRHLNLLAAVSVLAFTASATASDHPMADPNRVRAHVEFLADDQLEGRGTGEHGYDVAAVYVATQYRALGLEPGGTDGGWYQYVPFRRATTVAEKTEGTLTVDGKSIALGADKFAVRPSLTQAERSGGAELVFVGYGMDEPLLGYSDYAGVDVKGKIVVYFRGSPDAQNSDINAHLGSTKLEAAARHGAIGMISIPSSGEGADRYFDFYSKRGATGWYDEAGNSSVGDGSIQFNMVLTGDAVDALFEGASTSLADLRARAAAKEATIGSFPLNARIDVKTASTWEEFKAPQVIGIMKGEKPEMADQYVALTGHLDHLGIDKDAKPGEDRIYNGALDNAAGISTMLEAARLYSIGTEKPDRSLIFIAFAAEELGLLGSEYYTEHPTVPIDKIVSVVNLDMPVPLYDFTDVVAFGAAHNTVAETVAKAGAEMGLSVSPDPMPEQGIFTRSDHYRFAEKGIPSILLFTGYSNGGEEEWKNFFAERYHKKGDDLTQDLHWDALARYADLNYRIGLLIADDPQRPRWYEGNYFGDLFDPGGERATPPRP